MEFRSEQDVKIAEKMLQFPLLGERRTDTWNLVLANEFHMTNDSRLFHLSHTPGRLPLYEGKMIWQFSHELAKPRYWVEEAEGRNALRKNGIADEGQYLSYQLYRLGFRDVAASTNERTMIATIVPGGVFTGNTIISSTSPANNKYLLAIVALLNSFVVDSFIRKKVTSHCNMFVVYQLPVPRLTEKDAAFGPIVERAARLICTTPEFDDLAREVGLNSHADGVTNAVARARLRAELDALIAHLYGLTETEFVHILATFPLVAEPIKVATHNAYRDAARGLIK